MTEGKSGDTPKPFRISETDLDAHVSAGRKREADERAAGLRAIAAHYDHPSRRVFLELSNGTLFAFPVKLVKGLERASAAQRAALALSPSGSGVIWEALDADMSVPGILAASFRQAGIATLLGASGGAVKSRAKAKASRANGAKGGRPKKSVSR